MNSKPLTINGITVQTTNACTLQYREDAATMLKCWKPDRIREYLAGIPEGRREVLRKELNRVKGK